ncbi:MAG: carbamate kinase [Lachnospirales bacterium]
MKQRIVIALGGNALGNDLAEQMVAVKNTSKAIVDLIEEGHEVVICHGNGPQVGMLNLAFSTAHRVDKSIPELPMSVCVGMSQGYIGYDLQNAMREELNSRGINKPVATIITQVLVDPKDPAFNNPTKPIGAFYTAEEAEKLKADGVNMVEDSGRGFRRVVASPKPVDIAEKDVVKAMLDAGQIPIAAGGGGIAVSDINGHLAGQKAVIDKDFASAKLAEMLDADYFIILTAVEKVAINFGKPEEKWLDTLSLEDAKKYIAEGQFGKGSMEPKVEAAISFASSKKGRKALITMLEKAKDGIQGKTGTKIEVQ